MDALLALSLYLAAAALSITTVIWAVADLGDIPDRCPPKTRSRRARPVFMRTGLLLATSIILISGSVKLAMDLINPLA